MFTGQNIVAVPYGKLDRDALRCDRPERYSRWPLRERSAAITLLQDGWYESSPLGAALGAPTR